VLADGAARGRSADRGRCGAGRHPIDPLIYGVNLATAETLRDLGATLNRAGGNSASLYNWRIDARNAGRDWFFESLPVEPGEDAQYGDRFVERTRDAGAAPMVTIPIGGWVARLGPGRSKLAGFSTERYGPQAETDPYFQ
jgi:hypothetical protein